jgi:hypothetical protein
LEQDHLLRRDQPLSKPVAGGFALLLAAHGERRAGADNEGVAELAARLAAQRVAAAVALGFLKGAPSIGDAVLRLAGRDLVVYPLFLSDPRRLEQAGTFDRGRAAHVLPPLGLDPALRNLIVDRARAYARMRGWSPALTDLVLLAHGSGDNAASRLATERIARQIAAMRVFAQARPAFLEEPPLLHQAIATPHRPASSSGFSPGKASMAATMSRGSWLGSRARTLCSLEMWVGSRLCRRSSQPQSGA